MAEDKEVHEIAKEVEELVVTEPTVDMKTEEETKTEETKTEEEMKTEDEGEEAPKIASLTEAPDAADTSKLHPLQNAWTLWYNSPPKKGSEWAVKKIMTYSTVEDFWRLYNNIAKPSEVQTGSNYHLFKDGIEPNWECSANAEGGKWVLSLPRRRGAPDGLVDDAWQWTLLTLIGEFFDQDGDEICGVVISPRKSQNRLALWTRNAWNEAACKRIGTSFKTNLLAHLRAANNGRYQVADMEIGYQVHKDALKHGTSFRNSNLYKA